MISQTCVELWKDFEWDSDDRLRISLRWYNDGTEVEETTDIKLIPGPTDKEKGELFLSIIQWKEVIDTANDMLSEIRRKAEAILAVEEKLEEK